MNIPTDIILKNAKLLTEGHTEESVSIPFKGEVPMPSLPQLKEIVELAKAIFFPGFFGDSGRTEGTRQYHTGVHLERLYILLEKQISRGLHFFAAQADHVASQNASELSSAFIDRLPEIKRLLCTDIKAVFDGDPAAKSYAEVIFCYPAILSMVHYRMAHELLTLGIPVIPRIITELAHSKTGIDIHPGAVIGEYFSIDHGTGVVIGETCIIGSHVRLYQGVTLGARSFTLDERGLPMNVPRHPILEDNVIVYSNSTILGRITIGRESIIGGNVWLTNSVPPGSRILQQRALSTGFTDGLGI